MEQREGAEVWSFYEGPPTANGRPGSHHVLSRVFKDIYPRYRSMRGYRVPRKAGWDCHGLPVELEVEKQLGISSKQEIEEYGIAEFNAKCRESVFTYVEEWNRLTERIGFWIDLDDPYVTLDNDYIESVWWSLKELWKDDRLYEGHRVSPYCPRCGTALSSHEVALGYRDVTDPSVHVRFPLIDDSGERTGESLLVWTTTPWTLPGNYAVAVSPKVIYARVEIDGPAGPETVILAEALVEKVLGEGVKPTSTLEASELIGRRYDGPVFDLTDGGSGAFEVIPGEFVTTDDGTGLVHIAPAYGEDDYRVAIETGLYEPGRSEAPLYNPVGLDGNFTGQVTGFEDRFVKDEEVTAGLIAELDRRGLLFRADDYEHSYPHCWRCSTPLLYYAKASWYIRTSEAREQMLAGNEEIGWHPEHIKDGRFGKWLENNVDWALSRDRYWGTPLPVWECDHEDCDNSFCAGSVQELKDLAGEVPDDLHRPYIDEVTWDCECGEGRMKRVVSVIDTWYDSGRDAVRAVPLPLRESGGVRAAFPGRLHLRGDRPDPRLVLHPAGRVDHAFRHPELPQLRLPRADPRRRWPEDVEVEGQRGRTLGSARQVRRRCLPLVPVHRAAAVGGLPLLARGNLRGAAQLPADPLEYVLVLGALRQRRRLRRLGSPGTPWRADRPRPVGDLPPAGNQGIGRRQDGRLRLHRGPAARSPSSSRSSQTGTCGSRAGGSGKATKRPCRRFVTAWSRSPACWPRSPRSSPTRSTRTWSADPPASSASCPTRSTCAISPPPSRRYATSGSKRRWKRPAARSSSAALRAPTPKRRCASHWLAR